jgi:hypothetical protein
MTVILLSFSLGTAETCIWSTSCLDLGTLTNDNEKQGICIAIPGLFSQSIPKDGKAVGLENKVQLQGNIYSQPFIHANMSIIK